MPAEGNANKQHAGLNHRTSERYGNYKHEEPQKQKGALEIRGSVNTGGTPSSSLASPFAHQQDT